MLKDVFELENESYNEYSKRYINYAPPRITTDLQLHDVTIYVS